MAGTENNFQIPNLKDEQWIDQALEAFELAGKIPGAQQPRLSISVAGESFQYDPKNPDTLTDLRGSLATVDGRYISTITIVVGFPAQKGQQQAGNVNFTVNRRNPSPVADLKVTVGQHTSGVVNMLGGINAVVAIFKPIDPIESKVNFATDDAAQYLRLLDEKLQQLSNVAIEQTSKVTESLRKQALRNQEALDHDRGKLQEEYERRDGELDQREEQLKQRTKDVDLADAKTSRRKLRDQLKEKLDKLAGELKFTAQTNNDRWVLYIVLTAALLVGAIVVIEAGFAMRDPVALQGSGGLLLAIRAATGSILFGSVLVFFIRWQSAWVRHRTTEELRLLRTSLDVERASWVVETLVEFKNEQIEKMPDALLAAVTRNLFAEPGQVADVSTPIDDVADILRNGAESVKLKLGDHELVLDRRSLKKLSTAQSSD